MAYLSAIRVKCEQCQIRRAIVEVFNRRNASQGKFCRLCGRYHLKRVQQAEEAEREREQNPER